jgi:hemin uptake protein HemP
MTSRHLEPTARPDEGRVRPTDTVRRLRLVEILGDDREVVIEFNGADYHLRITRNEKLILTK